MDYKQIPLSVYNTNELVNFETSTDCSKTIHVSIETIRNKIQSGQEHNGYKFLPKQYITLPDYVV